MVLQYKPVILIGAARSGTKLVRDLIALHPDVDKVPYDINYIWRIGNENISHDELSPKLISARTRPRIISAIGKYSKGAPFLIEKTVSNCLRLPYVLNIFPNSLFIHLIRDGRDVVESACRQWLSSPDWPYILRKAASFPLFVAWSYAVSYAVNTAQKLLIKDLKKVGTWGVRYQGIDEDVVNKTLAEVCAIQWVQSVSKAMIGLAGIPIERVLTVRYEDFVKYPHEYLKQISHFLKIDDMFYQKLNLSRVSKDNIGKGILRLNHLEGEFVLNIIGDLLTSLKYT